MKTGHFTIALVVLAVSYAACPVLAIGISPARWPSDLTEYNCHFDSAMGHTLTRPSTRYSLFSVYDTAGLTGIITGCGALNSFGYIDDKTILVDWESDELLTASSTTATISVQSPAFWDCPAEPGGGAYVADLVRHSDAIDTGSGIVAGVATVSQIALYRNYAPRAYIVSYEDSVAVGESAGFILQFEDKQSSWFSKFPDRNYNGGPWLSYSVDWEGDGIIDLNGAAIWDEEPSFDSQYKLYEWTSGLQASTALLNHVYGAPGDYMATVTVRDHSESATLEMPVHVIPEPATVLLLGAGGLFLRRGRRTKQLI